MVHPDQLKKITERLESLQSIDVEALTSRSGWGEFNFEAARPLLAHLASHCKFMRPLHLELLPNTVANDIKASLDSCSGVVTQIRSFNLVTGGGDASTRREGIITALDENLGDLLRRSAHWASYLALLNEGVETAAIRIKLSGDAAEQLLDGVKSKVGGLEKQVEDIIGAARLKAGATAVAVFSSTFRTEAGHHEKSAENWLKATGASVVVLLIAAVLSGFLGESLKDPGAIFSFTTSKVVALLALFTATIWCGRMYKGAKHQAAVNRHRANALDTFQAFVAAASDEPTKNAVLLETTRSIFAISPSGFLESTEPAADQGTKVLEIVKGLKA